MSHSDNNQKTEVTFRVNGFLGTGMWLALGLISYLLIGEYSVFLWSDPWVYVYMVFWPVIWAWTFIVWAVIIVVVGFILFVLWDWFKDRM